MMMKTDPIDALIADLTPVVTVSATRAWTLVLGATMLATLAIALRFGLRADVVAGAPGAIIMIRGGTLLLLGAAATLSVITAAKPAVGQTSQGWRWALAAAALFPITSLYLAAMQGRFPEAVIHASSGPWCLGLSGGSALLIGGCLIAWLRSGAPTAINRVSWLTGLAAGAFGTFAYSLHCPSDTVHYIGLWYTAAIALCAGVGRLIIPQLIRW
jgi:hypothetical protein